MKKIIEKIAKETGLVENFVERFLEYALGKNIFVYSFVARDINGKSIEDYLMNIQRKVILDIEKEGSCVIDGERNEKLRKIMD